VKKQSLVLVIGLGLILIAGGVFAASDSKPLTINAQVIERASLTLEVATINFPDTDPDTTPIPATENPVDVTVKVRAGSTTPVTLTHQTAGNLRNAALDEIPIGNVTWTATGAGFQGGTMNSTVPQTAGSWTGPGNRPGTFSYFLVNSWDYAIGDYSVSSTYILSAP
jgi:hypothetical protein